MAGRRPLPTAVKELAGNPGHRPLNDDEPKPEVGMPEMPKGMAKAARREWNFIVPALLRLGVLTKVDGKALAAYCDAYAHWEQARKEIEKYGLVVEEPVIDKDGFDTGRTKLKANPAVRIYDTFGKLMKAFLIEFGLTPASRSKIHLDFKPATKDPMEELLSRNKNAVEDIKAKAPFMFNTGKPVEPAKTSGMPAFPATVPEAATNFEA